jgi:hypothetical protein
MRHCTAPPSRRTHKHTHAHAYRLCGQVVSNAALLEEHLTLCKLRAAARQKCAGYNAELRRGCGVVQAEIEVRASTAGVAVTRAVEVAV